MAADPVKLTQAVSTLVLLTAVAGVGYGAGPEYAAVAVGALAGAVILLGLGRYRRPRTASAPAVIDDESVLFTGRQLATIITSAAFVRIGVALILNGTALWGDFAPDAVYYQLSGQAVLDSWSGPANDLERWIGDEGNYPLYTYLNALSILIFGSSRYPLSIVNGLLGIFVAWNFARYAQSTHGVRAGRFVFIVSLFFPSVVLWSCMNIREVWSFLVLSLVLLSAQRARSKFSLVTVGVLVGSIAAMYLIRPYLVPILAVGVALSFLVVRAAQVPYALVSLFAIALFAQTLGPSVGLEADLLSSESLEAIHMMRVNLAFGGSAYGADVDTRTLTGSIAYLPEGITRFLLAPFPWAISSQRQLITLPESLVWYYILFSSLRGILSDIRSRLPNVVTCFFVLVLVTAAYGLVSGNEGTAYRHRAQVMLLFFVFAGGDYARRARQRSAAPGAPRP